MKYLQLHGLKFVTQELCLKLCILQKLFTLKLILFDFSYFIFLFHFYKPAFFLIPSIYIKYRADNMKKKYEDIKNFVADLGASEYSERDLMSLPKDLNWVQILSQLSSVF